MIDFGLTTLELETSMLNNLSFSVDRSGLLYVYPAPSQLRVCTALPFDTPNKAAVVATTDHGSIWGGTVCDATVY